MKKLLLSRRGAAIELAMAVIFLMMALCIILVSVATLQKSQRQKDLNDLDNKIEHMQITDCIIEGSDLPEGFYYETTERTENEKVYIIYDVYEGDDLEFSFTVDAESKEIISWN